MSIPSYGFYVSPWQVNKSKILELRQRVFIDELGMRDEYIQEMGDPESIRVIAYDGDSNPIGTGCLNMEGGIRHLLVLSQWRRRTIGKAIMIHLCSIANSKKLYSVFVNSPENQLGFYRSLEFDTTDTIQTFHGVRHNKLIKLIRKSNPIVH